MQKGKDLGQVDVREFTIGYQTEEDRCIVVGFNNDGVYFLDCSYKYDAEEMEHLVTPIGTWTFIEWEEDVDWEEYQNNIQDNCIDMFEDWTFVER